MMKSKKMKMYTADRETGTFIDEVSTIAEGLELIRQYEENDRDDGTYTEDFYAVVDENHCEIPVYTDAEYRLYRAEDNQNSFLILAGEEGHLVFNWGLTDGEIDKVAEKYHSDGLTEEDFENSEWETGDFRETGYYTGWQTI